MHASARHAIDFHTMGGGDEPLPPKSILQRFFVDRVSNKLRGDSICSLLHHEVLIDHISEIPSHDYRADKLAVS